MLFFSLSYGVIFLLCFSSKHFHWEFQELKNGIAGRLLYFCKCYYFSVIIFLSFAVAHIIYVTCEISLKDEF